MAKVCDAARSHLCSVRVEFFDRLCRVFHVDAIRHLWGEQVAIISNSTLTSLELDTALERMSGMPWDCEGAGGGDGVVVVPYPDDPKNTTVKLEVIPQLRWCIGNQLQADFGASCARKCK
jgi:hypothetical protein